MAIECGQRWLRHSKCLERNIAVNEFPAWLASTLASDATEGRGVLPPWIGSLQSDARAVGPAFVALMSQDDNLSVREAIKASHPPGSVLVVAGGSTSRTATIGGVLALEMQNAGYLALLPGGLLRKMYVVRPTGFCLCCRGVTPAAS